MFEPVVLALMTSASVASSNCGVRCPCVVPVGVDWHSASVMVPLARRDAYAVFLGQVIRADTVAQDTSSLSPDRSQYPRRFIRVKSVRYTFAVERTWKGPRDRELVLTSYDFDTSCGRAYATGVTYLVYADRDRRSTRRHDLSTYSCSRVRAASEAEEDLEVLGSGRTSRQ